MTLDIITADTLAPLRHGFFTRAGGASSGVFAGLNCGHGSSDQHEAVSINRARVASALDLGPESLLGVHQVHSADVVVVQDPDTLQGPRPMADAMVTNWPGVALTVLTADCQPVLFADHQAGIIGAAHAGWKGALAGILDATIDAMEGLGAERGRIHAVIGPCISQRCYEVGPELFEAFFDEDRDNARFFINGEGDRYLFDLPGFGLHRLRRAGLASADWTRHCTYADPARFFSYRRSTHAREADYGRLIAAIRL